MLLKDMKRCVKNLRAKEKEKEYSVRSQKAYVLVLEVEGSVERKWAYRRYMWEGEMV
jgi:hypothetical protein